MTWIPTISTLQPAKARTPEDRLYLLRIKRRLLAVCLVLITLGTNGATTPKALVEQGVFATQRGDFASAITHWTQALSAVPEAATWQRSELLIRRGEAYRVLGYYRNAAADLETALALTGETEDPARHALAAAALGNVYLLARNTPSLARDFRRANPEPLLRESQRLAEQEQLHLLVAVSANYLGNLQRDNSQPEAAESSYRTSLQYAQRAQSAALAVTARVNLAQVAVSNKRVPNALDQLRAAYASSPGIHATRERAALLVSIGSVTQSVCDYLANRAVKGCRQFSSRVLSEAAELAESLDDQYLISQARGFLGAIYESTRETQRAVASTEQAIISAQRADSHELLLRWEWQLARLARAEGNIKAATAAYRRAVFHIEAIRTDIPLEYAGGRSSFRETLAPVYLGLADLLLKQASQTKDPETEQQLLTEARNTVELIKTAELQDYFRDACPVIQRSLEEIAPQTAVLYPIIFPDRLELLITLADRKYRKSIPVDAEMLTLTAERLALTLRDSSRPPYLLLSNQLYHWLIAPFTALMADENVDTLIFVPDGALRQVPIAALFDGQQFLVQRYAIATTPGLTLLDPDTIARRHMVSLLAGLSKPGPVVDKIAPHVLANMFRSGAGRSRGGTIDVNTLVSQPTRGDLQEALALPGVTEEINTLAKQLPGEMILDKGFTLERFENEVETRPYRVVHIASHGYFGGSPDENFIMAYDDVLDITELEGLLRPKELADDPVELLTLSACQTAAGDDRSPLGLSGVALKAGVRSALGSLWSVSDEATRELLTEFYAQLKNPTVSKAQALQRAQVAMLQDSSFSHPYFWSPFILIGNWL